MADMNMELHSRDQVWKAIGDVAKQQASTEARIGALETAVDSGFSQIQNTLQNLVQRQSMPFPIWNLVSAIGVLSIILGGYATLITQPLYTAANRHYVAIEDIQHEDSEAAIKVARLEAQVEALERELRNIDQYGSRRWIEDDDQ